MKRLQGGIGKRVRLLLHAEVSNSELVDEFMAARKDTISKHYHAPYEESFKKIQYNRYADDFVIGVIGSKKDAMKVKEDMEAFLRNELHL